MDAVTPGIVIETGWTEARVDRLKALWAEHKSASEIAADLGGVSRCAVLGKAHRLGLESHQQKSASSRRYRTISRTWNPAWDPSTAWLSGEAKQKLKRPIQEDFIPRNISLMELKPDDCRFVTTEQSPHLFCGQPQTDGSSYCHLHHSRTHSPGMNLTDEERQARAIHAKRVMPATAHAKLAEDPIGLMPEEGTA